MQWSLIGLFFKVMVHSVTFKKLPNVFKSCPKMIPPEKGKIFKSYKSCLKCELFGQNICCHRLWKVGQSAINRPIWSHCSHGWRLPNCLISFFQKRTRSTGQSWRTTGTSGSFNLGIRRTGKPNILQGYLSLKLAHQWFLSSVGIEPQQGLIRPIYFGFFSPCALVRKLSR